MSSPSSVISPVTLAPLVRSCKRLIARRSVVLPEPEGPIIDVTRFLAMSKVASRTATLPLKETATFFKLMIVTCGPLSVISSIMFGNDASGGVSEGAEKFSPPVVVLSIAIDPAYWIAPLRVAREG